MVMLAYYAFKGIQSNGSLVALVFIGGVVGWAIWRVAYRRTALEG